MHTWGVYIPKSTVGPKQAEFCDVLPKELFRSHFLKRITESAIYVIFCQQKERTLNFHRGSSPKAVEADDEHQ